MSSRQLREFKPLCSVSDQQCLPVVNFSLTLRDAVVCEAVDGRPEELAHGHQRGRQQEEGRCRLVMEAEAGVVYDYGVGVSPVEKPGVAPQGLVHLGGAEGSRRCRPSS